MTKTLVQQQFGAHAAAYATSAVHAKGASLGRLVELVQPKSDWRALDIATGAGHTAAAFAPHVAHVIASDGHDTRHRPPVLDEAYAWLSQHYGEDTARLLCVTNPGAALTGEPMRAPGAGLRPKRGWFFFLK